MIQPFSVFLSEDHVTTLTDSHGDGAVSVYAPMESGSLGIRQNRLRWKTISTQIDKMLSDHQIDAAISKKTLAHVESLIDDTEFWTRQSCGLASFISPNSVSHIRLHTPPAQSITVERRFNLRSLLPEINEDFRYCIVAKNPDGFRLSKVQCMATDETRLSIPAEKRYGSMHTCHYPDITRSTQSMVLDLSETTSTVADSNFQNQTELLSVLDEVLAKRTKTPVFFAGTQSDFDIFSENQTYENFQTNPIDWDGDDDNWEQVIRESRSVICSRQEKQIDKILDSFRKWKRSDWASSDLSEIFRASTAGQVESLLISTEFNCFGCPPYKQEFDFATSSHTQRDHQDEDIVNLLMSRTIRGGGRAFCVPSNLMPEGVNAVALFGRLK